MKKSNSLIGLDLTKWEDPAKFDTQLKVFTDHLLSYFTSDKLLALFAGKDHDFARMAALPLLNEFVEKFDKSIKSLKASRLYKDEEKVEKFGQLIKLYFQVLEKWSTIIAQGSIQYNMFWPLDTYLTELQKRASNRPADANQLLPTPGFNVAAATLGSAAEFSSLSMPKTLEDIFTTIHQSLIVITSALQSNVDISKLNIPSLLKQIDTLITTPWDAWGYNTFHLSLMGLTLSKGQLHFFYNLPLQFHSAQFELIYNKRSSSVKLSFKFFGIGRSRWNNIALTSFLSSIANDIALSQVQVTDTGVEFTLHITKSFDEKELTSLLHDTVSIANWALVDDKFIQRAYAKNPEKVLASLQTITKDIQEKMIGRLVIIDPERCLHTATKNKQIPITVRLLFLSSFAENGQKLNIVLPDIVSYLTNNSSSIRANTLRVLNSIALNGHALDPILSTAIPLLKDGDSLVRTEAVKILNTIASKGHELDTILSTAIPLLKDGDSSVKNQALKILNTIALNWHALDTILSIATSLLKEGDSSLKNQALKILNERLNTIALNWHALDTILSTAITLLKDGDSSLKNQALKILNTIASKRHTLDTFLSTAITLLKDGDSSVKNQALETLKTIASKRYDLDTILSAAIPLLKDGDSLMRTEAIKILNTIASRGHELDIILSAAIPLIKDGDSLVRTEAVKILNTIASKGHELDIILSAAIPLLKDDSVFVKENAVTILNIIASQGNIATYICAQYHIRPLPFMTIVGGMSYILYKTYSTISEPIKFTWFLFNWLRSKKEIFSTT